MSDRIRKRIVELENLIESEGNRHAKKNKALSTEYRRLQSVCKHTNTKLVRGALRMDYIKCADCHILIARAK